MRKLSSKHLKLIGLLLLLIIAIYLLVFTPTFHFLNADHPIYTILLVLPVLALAVSLIEGKSDGGARAIVYILCSLGSALGIFGMLVIRFIGSDGYFIFFLLTICSVAIWVLTAKGKIKSIF